MTMKNIRRIALGSVAGLTLAAGVMWGATFSTPTVSAQDAAQVGEQGTVFETQGRGNRGFGNRGGKRGGNGQMGGMLLANSLGITPVQLQEAQESARNATIDQAAAAGVITAEQAASIKAGERPTGDVSGLRTYMADVDKDTALATALGITREALQAAKDNQVQNGVEAGLITQEQGNQMLLRQKIQDATKAAVEQALNEAVAEGLITQEEADAMKSRGGRGFGGERGFGGPGRDGRGNRGQGRGFGQFFDRFDFNGGFNGGAFDGFNGTDTDVNPALNDA